MKLGIIGFPKVGKKTLYEILSGQRAPDNFTATAEIKFGNARIADPRFRRVAELFDVTVPAPAMMELVLFPKFDKETVTNPDMLLAMEHCDVLCHVVRCFEYDTEDEDYVYDVDPLRDIDDMNAELTLGDFLLADKWLGDLKEAERGGAPAKAEDKRLLQDVKKHLERQEVLGALNLDQPARALLERYRFLTLKPLVLVLNRGDEDIADDFLVEQVRKHASPDVMIMQISARLESELLALDDVRRDKFLAELDIKDNAIRQISNDILQKLNIIVFYTFQNGELRSWTIKADTRIRDIDRKLGKITPDVLAGAKVLNFYDIKNEEVLKFDDAGVVRSTDASSFIQDGDIFNID